MATLLNYMSKAVEATPLLKLFAALCNAMPDFIECHSSVARSRM